MEILGPRYHVASAFHGVVLPALLPEVDRRQYQQPLLCQVRSRDSKENGLILMTCRKRGKSDKDLPPDTANEMQQEEAGKLQVSFIR